MSSKDVVRPGSFDEFVGQEPIVTTLRNAIASAQAQRGPVSHILFVGEYGMGKTTLVRIITNELGVGLKVTQGRAIERAGDLGAILTNLREGDILLVEDIHLLENAVAEVLAPAMADYSLDMVIGKGPGRRSIRLSLPRFTVVGTTATPSLIPSSLARSFAFVLNLQTYSDSDMDRIVQQMARKLDQQVGHEASRIIASLAKGLPWRALQLLHQWFCLTGQHSGSLSSSDALARLSQVAQDYQIITEGLQLEQAPTTAYLKKLIRQLESRVEERLMDLEARMDDLEGRVDELFGS